MLILEKQEEYTSEQHALWKKLYREMSGSVWPDRVCKDYQHCLRELPIKGDEIPNIWEMSEALQSLTGWTILGISKMAPGDDLAECFIRRQFPVCVGIRKPEHIDFSPEPDIWHDIMGHVVMLANPKFAESMHAYGFQYRKAVNRGNTELCGRVFYQAEVGIIHTVDGFRVYGPASVTSKKEALKSLHPRTTRLPFELELAMRTPFTDAEVQETYLYVDSFDHLLSIMTVDWDPLYRKITART
jgi:phenylalanine-4-hydroxylase